MGVFDVLGGVYNLVSCLSPFFVGKKKEKLSKVIEDGRGKRNAIRLHEAYTVETVVVADSDMVQYHGAEAAQRFLLTVMNMVGIPRIKYSLILDA